MKKIIAMTLIASSVFLAACSGGSTQTATEESLSSFVKNQAETLERAIKNGDASLIVKATADSACPVSPSDAILGLALLEGFGFEDVEYTVDSVEVIGNSGTATVSVLGETEISSYEFANGKWINTTPCEK